MRRALDRPVRALVTVGVLVTAFETATAQEKVGTWVEVRTPHFIVVGDGGEKDGRRVANQFEEIRAVFHDRFSNLRVDDGRPFMVIAAKNEASMKAFLPDYWAQSGGVKPVGVFVPRFDRNFAVIRTDISGFAENPYQVLYHEYTHTLLRLNFQALPLWLNEGLAQFYGNTVIGDKQTDVGRVTTVQLQMLLAAKLIPIDELVKVDEKSPYYRESDQATTFYPESWAIVHYLMSDPDAVKQNLLGRYLMAMDATGDAVEAARQAFGGLDAFQRKLEMYVRQPSFYVQRRSSFAAAPDRDRPARVLQPAEALTIRVDILQRTGHAKDARPLLAQIVQMDPRLADVHTALGFDALQQEDAEAAEKEFSQSISLGAVDFRPYYYRAAVLSRRNPMAVKEIADDLEHALMFNPDFAPASAFLSQAYLQLPDKRAKAVDVAVRAVQLEPAVFSYRLGLGEALFVLRRFDEARTVATGLLKAAQTADEKASANGLMTRVAAAAPSPR